MSGAGESSDDEPSPGDNPSISQTNVPAQTRTTTDRLTDSSAVSFGVNKSSVQGRSAVHTSKSILPAEKVFPIQIGTKLFRLSGASIISDGIATYWAYYTRLANDQVGPSYFTQFFEDQIRQNEESGGVRTLYIDRDPVTFRDIARHLQGYFIKPKDGEHFVKLFADAQFYSLPRLIEQLFEAEIFIQIGGKHFQIPKDLFSDPGNSPNFFSLGFAVFFSSPNDVFPGLDQRGLLRPPPISPPYVPSRSAEIFTQLLHILRGYPPEIRDETHRAALLRDCRYFHLRGLEQKIIAHEISYNLERQKTEICLRLDDVKPSGISYQADDDSTSAVSGGWVSYKRPFVDETIFELVVEIGGESMEVDLEVMRAEFHGAAKRRVASLLQVVANKMNLPAKIPLGLVMLSGGTPSPVSSPGFSSLSDDRVKVRFEPATDLNVDGAPYFVDWLSDKGRVLHHGPLSSSVSTESSVRSSSIVSDLRSEHDNIIDPKSSRKTAPLQTRMSKKNLQTDNLDTPPSIPPTKKRKMEDTARTGSRWTIKTGQWRLRIQPTEDSARSGFEVLFFGVKIDAFSHEQARNSRRKFLS